MPAETNFYTLLFLGALVVTIGILLYTSNRYFTRQRSQPPSWSAGRNAAPPSSRITDAPAEMQNWEVQMHDYARQIRGELDSKMRALQALIAEADRAAARLERALEDPRARAGSFPTSQAESLPPAPSPSTPGSTPQRREEICTLADLGLPASEIAQRTGTPIGEVELILGLRQRSEG